MLSPLPYFPFSLPSPIHSSYPYLLLVLYFCLHPLSFTSFGLQIISFLTSVPLLILFCSPRIPSLSLLPEHTSSKKNSGMSFYSFLNLRLPYPLRFQSVVSFELRVPIVAIIILNLGLQLFVYPVLYHCLAIIYFR